MSKPLILIEMNELCPDLLRKWMEAGELPNFSRFYRESDVFTTDVDVEDSKYLEPWIQWYSMHTGVNYDTHGVYHLTDGPKSGEKDIWGMLRDAGLNVGNFSSMNCGGFEAEGSFYVPDPWVTSERAYPQELQLFQDFVQNQVQEYTNPNKVFGPTEMAKTLAFLTGHGLSTKTIHRIVTQLSSEKLKDAGEGWKRVFILDWLCADVFRHYMRKTQPAFATFFSNSIAHCQHAYWRCMEPEKFDVQPSDDELTRYGDAILLAYKNSDAILGEMFKLERQGYQLALASALSQQPFLRLEGIGGQRFYRMHDVESALRDLQIPYQDVQPVMTHQYMVRFASGTERDAAIESLRALSVDGKALFQADPSDEDSLYLGNQLREEMPHGLRIEGFRGSNQELKFDDLFYLIDETKSGCHHPDGVLWFKTGTHHIHSKKVSILDVAPTILEWFGVPSSRTQSYNLMGRSLLPQFASAKASAA